MNAAVNKLKKDIWKDEAGDKTVGKSASVKSSQDLEREALDERLVRLEERHDALRERLRQRKIKKQEEQRQKREEEEKVKAKAKEEKK